uniref:Ubiquitin-like domain-containing protein n=1 Tax=Parastrongyloides trichosuri TaxID=131310 RepID=A0A0N4Z450_PARTI
MQLFVNNIVYEVNENESIKNLKEKIEDKLSIPYVQQRLYYGGKPLNDEVIIGKSLLTDLSTIHLNVELLGGGKKRKKKVYTTPKKIKHKRTKVKLAVLKYYKIDENGKISRIRIECTNPTCGGGVFMANHGNRHYCGKCHNTLIQEGASANKKGSGKKK